MSQPAHLLSLAALHTAAPSILDVIFGREVAENARSPNFRGPIWDGWTGHWVWLDVGDPEVHGHRQPEWRVWRDLTWVHARMEQCRRCCPLTSEGPLYLDLLIPPVAARLAVLCRQAHATAFVGVWADSGLSRIWSGVWSAAEAEMLAAVVQTLAPKIAALATASPR